MVLESSHEPIIVTMKETSKIISLKEKENLYETIKEATMESESKTKCMGWANFNGQMENTTKESI